MGRETMEQCLREVGLELEARGVTEIVIVGGAFMTLVLRTREATRDVDAYFDPGTSAAIRDAAARVGARHGLPADWLNDAVKGFFAGSPDVVAWAELPGLRVNAVTAQYMFAMKAYAGRPGDIDDLRALAAHLGIVSAQDAIDLVTAHVPERLLTPRAVPSRRHVRRRELMGGHTSHSGRQTLDRIWTGTVPWVAVGDLLDDWRQADRRQREDMMAEPLGETATPDEHRWAAFIAAAIDQLAWQAEPRMQPPAWVRDSRYVLAEPWFLLPGWRLRMHQLVDTPAAFKRRNIYGGDRIISRA